MQRRVFIGAAGAALIAGGAYIYLRPSQTPAAGLGSLSAQEAASVDTSGIPDMVLGDPDAPVTMVEYASFTCPHCASFHENTFPQLKADYIDSGKVRFVYREVFFDRFGLWAAMVARCGGDMRFFGIAEMIYDEQREWLDADTPAGIADNLRNIGRRAGLTDETLDACLQDADQAKAMVARYQQQSEEDDINATPSFIIDGQKYSNMGYADMREILDGKLGE